MADSVGLQTVQFNSMASTFDDACSLLGPYISQVPDPIVHNDQEMHPCWRKLPFEIVTAVISRLVDEDDIMTIMFHPGVPCLNKHGFFTSESYKSWNDLFSLCHYFHRYIFKLILQRATWSFNGYLQCDRVLHSWRMFEPKARNLVNSIQLEINCFSVGLKGHKELPRAFRGAWNIQKLYIRFSTYPEEAIDPVRYADELPSTVKKISDNCWQMISEYGLSKERPQSVQVEGLRDERLCRLIENRIIGVENDQEIIEAVWSCQYDPLRRFVSGFSHPEA